VDHEILHNIIIPKFISGNIIIVVVAAAAVVVDAVGATGGFEVVAYTWQQSAEVAPGLDGN
jgi:hypothetical protein